MAVISGKNIACTFGAESTTLLDLVEFSVEETPDPQVYSSGSTDGQKRRIPGVLDVTGSITVLAHDSAAGGAIPNAEITPGVSCALNLYEKSGDDDTKHAFTSVMWGEVSYGGDAESGAIERITIAFGNNGTYTRPRTAAAMGA